MKNGVIILTATLLFAMSLSAHAQIGGILDRAKQVVDATGGTGDNQSTSTPAPSNVPAILTITGLDEYNGLYLLAETPDDIYAAARIADFQEPMSRASVAIGGLIENGSVTLPVWAAPEEKMVFNEEKDVFDVVKERYTGNGPLNFFVRIWEGQEVFYMGYTKAGGNMSVAFNNGKAERVFVLTYTPEDDD